MLRPSLRRTPILESLETREVLSAMVGPTPDQQFALQLINFVRTDPSAAATMFVNDITPDVQDTLNFYNLTASDLVSKLDSATPQPPLAWNDALATTAQSQSQLEANLGEQTHSGPGEASMGARIATAGYSNAATFGENTYAWSDDSEEAMLAFLFDWGVPDDGHYDNIMQPGVSADDAYRDVGIGLVNTTNQGLGPVVLTQDFGSQDNETPQIVGVVFNDPNNTKFYAPGEGQGGVTIDAVNTSTGQDSQTQTWSSGGYEIPVAANGTYNVTATENGQVISSQTIQISNVNAEADFINNPADDTTSTPAPAPASLTLTPMITTTITPTTSTPTTSSTITPTTSSISTPTTSSISTPTTSSTSSSTSSTSSSTPTVAQAQLLTMAPIQSDQVSISDDQLSAPSTTTTSNSSSEPSWLNQWSRWTA
jgi:uncharacterized protein YkwD